MIAKFMSLDSEKRDGIINAALSEFAQKGYKNASTNEIVREANISKGLLFHYFENKKGLFFFLLDYCCDIVLADFYGKVNFSETDIICRWTQIAALKMEIIKQYPQLYAFMLAAVTETAPEVQESLNSRTKGLLEDGYRRLFEGIDYSKFREDVDVEHAMNIIMWTIDGFANRELEKVRMNHASSLDYESIVQAFDSYMEELRICFYKQEETS